MSNIEEKSLDFRRYLEGVLVVAEEISMLRGIQRRLGSGELRISSEENAILLDGTRRLIFDYIKNYIDLTDKERNLYKARIMRSIGYNIMVKQRVYGKLDGMLKND